MECEIHLHYYLLYSLDVFLLVLFSVLFYNIFFHFLRKCLTETPNAGRMKMVNRDS